MSEFSQNQESAAMDDIVHVIPTGTTADQMIKAYVEHQGDLPALSLDLDIYPLSVKDAAAWIRSVRMGVQAAGCNSPQVVIFGPCFSHIEISFLVDHGANVVDRSLPHQKCRNASDLRKEFEEIRQSIKNHVPAPVWVDPDADPSVYYTDPPGYKPGAFEEALREKARQDAEDDARIREQYRSAGLI